MPTARLKRGLSPGQARAKAGDGEMAPEAVSDDEDQADEEAEIKDPAQYETRQFGRRDNLGCRGVGRATRQQWAVDEPARQVDGDEVQHQGRHDLVDAEAGAQKPGEDQPSPSDNGRGSESKRNKQSARPAGKTVADDSCDNAAEIEAALRADIEYTGAKGDRRSEPGQQ